MKASLRVAKTTHLTINEKQHPVSEFPPEIQYEVEELDRIRQEYRDAIFAVENYNVLLQNKTSVIEKKVTAHIKALKELAAPDDE